MTVDFSGRAHWDNYNPATFGWSGKWDPTLHPNLLVPFKFTTSRGEVLDFGRMHVLAVPIFREFYRQLDAAHPGMLDGDRDEGCFNPRSKTMGNGRSFHSWGIATDTDWNDNPMGVNAKRRGPHGLRNDTDEIGRPLGIQWGGTWRDFKDWMHNEIHLSPADCIALARALSADPSIPADPLEEIMAFFKDKNDAADWFADIIDARIETKVRQVVREEGNKGFNVRYLINNTGKSWGSIEAYMEGVKGYTLKSVRDAAKRAARAAAAAAAAKKAARK